MSYPITSQITQDLAQDSWSPTGDTVDHAWHRFLRYQSGKAHPQAAAILGRVVYMYRPARENVLDPESGIVCEVRFSQKFKMDLWQTSRQSLADTFGFTIREIDSGLSTLRKSGVIYTELRSIKINGIRLSNVLYVGLNLLKLKEISTPIAFERNTSSNETAEVERQKVASVSLKSKTGTKTSLQIPRKTTTANKTCKLEKSSSPPASPSTSKPEFNIPETILKLIPEHKQNDNELSKVSAALSVSSIEIVIFNITRALAKAKKDDPWGMVSAMLNDLAYKNCDWYETDRERIAEKEEKHAASRMCRAKEDEAIRTNEERESREREARQKIYLKLPAEAQQAVRDEAKRRVEPYSSDANSIALVITDVIRDIQNGSWEPPEPTELDQAT